MSTDRERTASRKDGISLETVYVMGPYRHIDYQGAPFSFPTNLSVLFTPPTS